MASEDADGHVVGSSFSLVRYNNPVFIDKKQVPTRPCSFEIQQYLPIFCVEVETSVSIQILHFTELTITFSCGFC